MHREVGIGPILLLYTTKSLCLLYLWLAIINIPVYTFFYNGREVKSNAEISKFQDYFALLSLGNIGQSSFSCSETNWNIDNDMVMSCPSGTLGELELFGISKNNNATCSSMSLENDVHGADGTDPNEEFLDPECTIDSELMTIESKQNFLQMYQDTCYEKTDCLIDLGKLVGTGGNIKESCSNKFQARVAGSKYGTSSDQRINLNYNENLAEPVILARAMCYSSMIRIPYTTFEFAKD